MKEIYAKDKRLEIASTRPTITIEEEALELFPDELFQKDFQRELNKIYDDFISVIDLVRNPIKRYTVSGNWNIIYRLELGLEKNKMVREDVGLLFQGLSENKLLHGVVHIKPDPEPSLEPLGNILEDNSLTLVGDSERILAPSFSYQVVTPLFPIEPFSFKCFERNIFFIDARNTRFLWEYLKYDPIILNEAIKRFPQSGLLAIELNRALQVPNIIYPSSRQFPKLQNFAKKINQFIRSEISKGK